MEHITKSLEETQALAREWVASLGDRVTKSDTATVVGLSGDLGSGKTSFTQGVALALGVTDHVTSPTFILQRRHKIHDSRQSDGQARFTILIHIDCYRLDTVDELKHLGLDELVKDPANLILIEWPERVASALPADMEIIKFEFVDDATRRIEIKL